MKTAKRALSILLAVVMMSSLFITAFAASGDKHDLIISGAESIIKEDVITEGTAYPLPTTAAAAGLAIPADKVLYGWNVQIGTGTAYDVALTDTTGMTIAATATDADVTIKPIWGYVVSYDINDGDGTTPSSVVVPANTAMVKDVNQFQFAAASFDPPSGMAFAYWELGSSKYGAGAIPDTITFTNNVTVEAIYKTVVSVNFLPGDGVGDDIENVTVPKVFFLPTLAEANAMRTGTGTAIAAPTDPAGMEFVGWMIGTDVYQPGDLVTLADDTDIVAQWKKRPSTITINGAKAGHTFHAYQIFIGDAAGSKLSNIQWGDAYPSSTERTALKAYNWKFDDSDTAKAAELTALTATSPAAAFAKIINYIKETNDHKELLDLAEILAKNAASAAAINPDTGSQYVFSGLDDGYYVVADEATGTDDADFISDYILEVVNDVTVNVKGSVPTVDKSVSEDGTNFEDTAAEDPMGVQVGDTLNYKIEGTLPSNYADYKEYGIVFSDTMDPGLTLDTNSIKLYIGSTEVNASDYTITYPTVTSGTQMVVKIVDLKAVTPNTEDEADKNYDSIYSITAASVIKLVYNCVVNEKAVLDDDGVKNTVKMNFTNDPNQDNTGEPTTGGETPPDEVFVEVTNFKFVKTDGSSNALLIGAEFKLYDSSDVEIKFVACYVDSVSGEEVVVDNTDDDKVALIEYYRVATAAEKTGTDKDKIITDIIVHTKDQVIVDGLDADELYYLEETVAPDGYNKLTAKIEIQPNKSTDGSDAGIDTDGNYVPADNTGTIYNVQNNSGMELPETGGMGTVIFVTIGAVVFMATMLVLVTKKRMYNEG